MGRGLALAAWGARVTGNIRPNIVKPIGMVVNTSATPLLAHRVYPNR
jgi:hypothetical protein